MSQWSGLCAWMAASTVLGLFIANGGAVVPLDLRLGSRAIAQSITPNGTTDTTIAPVDNRYDITGTTLSNDGTNLFHDLAQFGLSKGEIANFMAQPGVENILTRVMAGDASIINGLIQVSDLENNAGRANLFLMNPAGLIFGTDASLNVLGDFTATTATGIGFDSGWFSAIGDTDYELLTGSPNRLAFGLVTDIAATEINNGVSSGVIVNAGTLETGGDLALLGGSVVNLGRLSAPSDIVVAAIPGQQMLRIDQPGNLLSLEIQPLDLSSNPTDPSNTDFSNSDDLPNFWSLPILKLPELLTGGEVSTATNIVINEARDAIALEPGDAIVTNGISAANVGRRESGGNIQILGSDIYLAGALVDASGSVNGGTVLIGGDLANPDRVPLSDSITVGTTEGLSTTILAEGLDIGNGGRIDLATKSPTRPNPSGPNLTGPNPPGPNPPDPNPPDPNPTDDPVPVSAPAIAVDGVLSATGGDSSGNGGLIQSNQNFPISSLDISVDAPNGVPGQIVGITTLNLASGEGLVPINISLPILIAPVDVDLDNPGAELITPVPVPPSDDNIVMIPPVVEVERIEDFMVVPPDSDIVTPLPNVIVPPPDPIAGTGISPSPDSTVDSTVDSAAESAVHSGDATMSIVFPPNSDVGDAVTDVNPGSPPDTGVGTTDFTADTPVIVPSPTVVMTIDTPPNVPIGTDTTVLNTTVVSPNAAIANPSASDSINTAVDGDAIAAASTPATSNPRANARSNARSNTLFSDCYGRFLQFTAPQSKGLLLRDAIALGNQCFQLGYYPQAQTLYQAVFSQVKDRGETALNASLRGHLGNLALMTGHYQQAIDQYQEQLKLVDRLDTGTAMDADNGTQNGTQNGPQNAEQANLKARLKARLKTTAMVNLGNVYLALHQYDRAIQHHESALIEARSLQSPSLEASILSSLGISALLMSDFPTAIAYQHQALAQFEQIDHHQGTASTLINLGLIDFSQGAFSQAVERYQTALAIAQTTKSQAMEASAWGNLGNVYRLLGNYYGAIEALQQQLTMARTIGDRQQEANALGSLGATYHSTEDYQQSIEFLQKQSFIVQDIGDRAGEGHALNNLGETYRELGQYQQALTTYQQALEIYQAIGTPRGKSVVLGNLGLLQADLENPIDAMTYHQQALAIKRQVGDRDGERLTLSEMGDVLTAQGRNELAIIFYKQSVNLSESIRQDLKALPLELQQSYADEIVADTYRSLADLLLQQDRILEAQQVLDLLKVQELEDYLGHVRGSDLEGQTGLDYHQPEQQILELYDQAIALGQELERLRQVGDRTPDQQTRLEELLAIESTLLASFFDFVDSPEIIDLVDQLSRTARRQNLDPSQLNALRDNLQNLNQNAVLLYPLILEDRLELILVTPYAPPIRRTVPVSRQVFNQTILNFRQELTKPVGHSFPSAQQLYTWLIAPFEADLAAANAETIVYAPDGQLRYIPLAALHDGNQWLIENYRVNHITSASLTDFNTATASSPQVLAAAFGDAGNEYRFDVGQRSFSFAGLPYAGLEVELIADKIPNTTSLFNHEFTRAQTVPKMNDHTIVHLATHAEFVSGTPEESFILFGDGDRATLRDVASWSLQNVDLVVLSACKTAVGGELGNGEEILGFGYQLQRTGARAAIASLWTVDDGGTQLLMNLFYAALNDPTLSKAEALQQAQIAMLNGDLSDLIESRPELANVADTYQHPRYWSPFILIGNGL